MPKSSPANNLLYNPHAGDMLLEEFLKPIGMSQAALARAIGVSRSRINGIVRGECVVSVDIDQRLTRHFGMSTGFFTRLQADFDDMERRRAQR